MAVGPAAFLPPARAGPVKPFTKEVHPMTETTTRSDRDRLEEGRRLFTEAGGAGRVAAASLGDVAELLERTGAETVRDLLDRHPEYLGRMQSMAEDQEASAAAEAATEAWKRDNADLAAMAGLDGA